MREVCDGFAAGHAILLPLRRTCLRGQSPPRPDAVNAAAVVSTECPSCGAPLDFDDGVRAIRCAHCRSQLLVTGRRQVLSYEIAPRISESDARSLVRFSLPAERRATRVQPARLHLVPYYRFTAEEIRWERGDAERDRRRNVSEVAGMLGVPVPGKDRWEAPVDPDEGLQFSSRVLEQNFVARETPLVPPSLGVRPSALQLRLFDHPEEEEEALVVAPDLTPRDAELRAVGDSGEEAALRELLRVVLQVVYFPFWMVPTHEAGVERVAIVDAVASSIVRDDADPAEVDALSAGKRRRTRTVGFRPLVCPNCGWDLPFRADDLLFQCTSCERAWLTRGDRLERVSFSVADHAASASRYLPVWRLGGGEGPCVYAPAFRCRRLKAVFDLGARLTRRAVRHVAADSIPQGLLGCALDELDARALGRFIASGINEEASRGAARVPLPDSLTTVPAELIWLPFESDGYALRDLETGSPVPVRLLAFD